MHIPPNVVGNAGEFLIEDDQVFIHIDFVVFIITANVRRYVHVAATWWWHGFLPSYWMWRSFRFTKSLRSAKTMTPGGSAPAFSRGQPAGFWEAALAARTG